MAQYPSNSFKSKNKLPEEKANPVVSHPVSIKKQRLGKRIFENVVSDDSKNVGSYILESVVIPLIKKGIDDGITGAIRMILYGDTSSRGYSRNASPSSATNRVSYRQYYDRTPEPGYRRRAFNTDIEMYSREEALDVLEEMRDYLATYGVVSLLKFYELTGAYEARIVNYDSAHNSFGWSNLNNATVIPSGNRWIINFTRPLPIS